MLHYEFPVIKHLDDIKSILEKPEFKLVQKDGYQVLSYMFQDSSTFETPLEAEARGLIFDMEGNVIARRFHKFFNVGERGDVIPDLSKAHSILEKLDGSMVSPIPRTDVRHSNEIQFRLGTKMGITDVSMQAEEWLVGKDNYIKFINFLLMGNFTPIFEWCSRKNRVVIDYPEDNLILTAIRHNNSGVYFTKYAMEITAKSHGIPCVKELVVSEYTLTNGNGLNIVSEIIKSREDSEGVIIRFADGHMVKIKSDWYVRIHKAKDALSNESKVLRIILDEQLDDLLPLLPEMDKIRVLKYRDELFANIVKVASNLENEFGIMKNMTSTRAEFAAMATKDPNSGILFNMYDGGSALDAIFRRLDTYYKKLDRVRNLIGTNYKDIALDA